MACALETTGKKFLVSYIHVGPAPGSAAEPLTWKGKWMWYFPLLPLGNSDLLCSRQISDSALPILALLSFVAFVGYKSLAS